jgi:hypothetical protein
VTKCTHYKCVVWWVLVSEYRHTTNNKDQNVWTLSEFSFSTDIRHSNHIFLLWFICIFAELSYKQNHTAYKFLCLASFNYEVFTFIYITTFIRSFLVLHFGVKIHLSTSSLMSIYFILFWSTMNNTSFSHLWTLRSIFFLHFCFLDLAAFLLSCKSFLWILDHILGQLYFS